MSEPILTAPPPPALEVVHDPAREKATRGHKAYTIKVGGQESLMWFPTVHAAQRCAGRLLLGRSLEAFGGSGVATAAGVAVGVTAAGRGRAGRGKVERSHREVAVSTAETKSGKAKPRETRPGFVFVLDGREGVHAPSEAEARALCAVEAFRTRGRLNPARHAEAEKAFREQKKKDCKVHQVGRRVVAKDDSGLLWLARFDAEAGEWRFKMIGQ